MTYSFAQDRQPTQTFAFRVEPTITTLRRLNIPTFALLSKVGRAQTLIQKPVNLAGAQAIGEASTEDVTTFSQDQVKQAYWDMAAYRFRSSFQMTAAEYADLQGAIRMGQPSDVASLLAFKSQSAQREILAKIGKAIFDGTGNAASGGVVGLETTVATAVGNKSTVPYAGIDPTDAGNALWTSLVYDADSEPVTDMTLAEFESDIMSGTTIGSPASYNALITHPRTALYLKELGTFRHEINMAYTDPVDVGFRGLTYAGNPVIEDPNAALDVIHFVDTSGIQLHFLDQDAQGLFGEERNISDIPMYVTELPNLNPERVNFAIYTKCQLVMWDRHSLATIKNLARPERPVSLVESV